VIIARKGSYHGNTLGALDASGRARLRAPYEPWLGRAVHVPAPYEYRCGFDDHPNGCGAHHAELLEAAINEVGPEKVAAFIAEPVIGATLGAVVPPDGYWAAVSDVCKKHGVLLIADEVMTGFGRTGRWFGSDHWSIRPDIMTAGKGASSGYWPLGIAACSGRVYDAIAARGFVHGYTYSHSIVGCAVAHEVLNRLQAEDLVTESRIKGIRLLESLRAAVGARAHVGEVRGLGLMLAVELVADTESKAPFERSATVTEKVITAAKERGLLLYPSIGGADGFAGDAVMMGPPFVVSESQIQEIVELFAAALDAVDVLNH
jgi:adenosylmethionine-8-amino-7-oxononanoate aminotransferase